MNKTDPKILSKIKKCLALAGSDNPNEAAVALRQAQAMIEKHGLDLADVTLGDIGQSESPCQTMSRDKPTQWEGVLASEVARAFGCKVMVWQYTRSRGHKPLNEGAFVFVGLRQQTEIAAFTATVLIRKCRAARQKWIASLTNAARSKGHDLPKGKKTVSGDAFAIGWVHRIAQSVRAFAHPPEVAAAIEAYIARAGAEDEAKVSRALGQKLGIAELLAARAGIDSAAGERLYRPMTGSAPQEAISAPIR